MRTKHPDDWTIAWLHDLHCDIRTRIWRALIAASATSPYDACPDAVEEATERIMYLIFETEHLDHIEMYVDEQYREPYTMNEQSKALGGAVDIPFTIKGLVAKIKAEKAAREVKS
jgi:hypothetical protein